MASTPYLLATVSTILVLCYSFRKRPKNLPPGPEGRFLVGNLSVLQLDGAEKVKTYVKWFEDYGTQ